MTTLALDLGRNTGWAAGAPCRPPTYGHFRINAGSSAADFLQMGRIVTALIREHSIDDVILEEPFVGLGQHASALMPLFGYRAAAMMAAKSAGIDPVMAAPGKVRKHFIGHGGLSRAKAKPAVMEKCQHRGWRPQTDDEGDALALWDYRCAVLEPNHLLLGFRKG